LPAHALPVSFSAFVLDSLPGSSRVLEVGCGDGSLARELSAAGHDVLAIDPVAPEGAIFQRVTLEELDDPGPFDAVVASRSLHHVHDLDAALGRIAALLPAGGLLLVDEFAHDRLDEPTADWYYGQLRALGAARGDAVPRSLEALREEWAAEHEGLHGSDVVLRALAARFEERSLDWEPYLWHYVDGVSTRDLERTLVDLGAIQALGYRYAGVAR
jgi:SAM-dependent methyltransferase